MQVPEMCVETYTSMQALKVYLGATSYALSMSSYVIVMSTKRFKMNAGIKRRTFQKTSTRLLLMISDYMKFRHLRQVNWCWRKFMVKKSQTQGEIIGKVTQWSTLEIISKSCTFFSLAWIVGVCLSFASLNFTFFLFNFFLCQCNSNYPMQCVIGSWNMGPPSFICQDCRGSGLAKEGCYTWIACEGKYEFGKEKKKKKGKQGNYYREHLLKIF